jgi:tetratricopeptide (TPR) repeat protein
MMDKQFMLEHRMKLAEEYESSGKYLHALQIYKSLTEENPFFIEAHIKTASLYRKTGNLEAAESLLKKIIDEDPESKEIRFYYGEFLLNNAKWEEAIEVLGYFLPEEEPITAFYTGYAYFMLKEYELGRISFKNFTRIAEPGDLLYEAYFFLAKIEVELSNYDAAIKNIKKAEPALSNFWEYNYISALIYFNLGMHAHAAKLIDKSITLNAREAVNFNLAGKIYLKLGDYPTAEKHLRHFIEMKDQVASDTYAFLAEACLNNRKTAEALDFFDKALAADPDNKMAIIGKKNAVEFINSSRVSDG